MTVEQVSSARPHNLFDQMLADAQPLGVIDAFLQTNVFAQTTRISTVGQDDHHYAMPIVAAHSCRPADEVFGQAPAVPKQQPVQHNLISRLRQRSVPITNICTVETTRWRSFVPPLSAKFADRTAVFCDVPLDVYVSERTEAFPFPLPPITDPPIAKKTPVGVRRLQSRFIAVPLVVAWRPKNRSCPLCMDALSVCKVAVRLPCGHRLHYVCFGELLRRYNDDQRNAVCPDCQNPIDGEDKRNVACPCCAIM